MATCCYSSLKIYITVIRKERFPAGKPKLVWKASLRFFYEFRSHKQSPFPFCINLEMCILVFNLESYGYFYMGICRSLCHSYNFVNMRFVVKVIFFPTKFYRKKCSHIFSWMNKFLFTENNFLPRLINQEIYSSPGCSFQNVYGLNTRSVKLHRRRVAKVIFALLIKQ